MKLRVRELRLSLDQEEAELKNLAAQKLGISAADIRSCKMVKKAIDARRKTVYFACTVDLDLADQVRIHEDLLASPECSILEEKEAVALTAGAGKLTSSPVIIGAGPAGLFCALLLARYGYKPVIIEQGQDMDQRVAAVEGFWTGKPLLEYSNTQFGEGGAGTFSDGKLTTRIGDDRVDYVLKTFVEFGAAQEILYLKKPHVGTDIIRMVVKRMRQEIIRLGGEFYFSARLTDINVNQQSIESIIINNQQEVPCSLLVLAVGNSAREVYRLLYQKDISLIAKSFAVGVRVEHPQTLIDKIQYGDFAGHPRLPAADYHLTYQDRYADRSLYTFCMCPGGRVIAAASGPGEVVTNGMSYFKRDSGIANSALVVTVSPADWDHEALGGIKLQQDLEQRAFEMGGGDYSAPAQFLKDFLQYQPSQAMDGSLASYAPGVKASNLWQLLPQEISEVMRRGLLVWGRKAPGFICDEAVLTGVETRTSAPLRIERDRSFCSVSVNGLYPCGEGAGYAGGIVSAAVDGLKVAETIISGYQTPLTVPEINSSQIIRGSQLEKRLV